VQEEQVLPHLAAIAILLAGQGNQAGGAVTGPDSTAVLIDRLRAEGTILTYDPDQRMLRAGGPDAPAVTLGTATITRSRQDRERRTAQGTADQRAPAVATGKDR
jgi:hypothetical protein